MTRMNTQREFTSLSGKSTQLSGTQRLLLPLEAISSKGDRDQRLQDLTRSCWQPKTQAFQELNPLRMQGRKTFRTMSIWRLFCRDRLRWRDTSHLWSTRSSSSKTSWEASPMILLTTLRSRTPRRLLTRIPWWEKPQLIRQSTSGSRETHVVLEELFQIQWSWPKTPIGWELSPAI